jgi:hypothetical protein
MFCSALPTVRRRNGSVVLFATAAPSPVFRFFLRGALADDTSIDIWSIGCIFAGSGCWVFKSNYSAIYARLALEMASGGIPLFRGSTVEEQLELIFTVLGVCNGYPTSPGLSAAYFTQTWLYYIQAPPPLSHGQVCGNSPGTTAPFPRSLRLLAWSPGSPDSTRPEFIFLAYALPPWTALNLAGC